MRTWYSYPRFSMETSRRKRGISIAASENVRVTATPRVLLSSRRYLVKRAAVTRIVDPRFREIASTHYYSRATQRQGPRQNEWVGGTLEPRSSPRGEKARGNARNRAPEPEPLRSTRTPSPRAEVRRAQWVPRPPKAPQRSGPEDAKRPESLGACEHGAMLPRLQRRSASYECRNAPHMAATCMIRSRHRGDGLITPLGAHRFCRGPPSRGLFRDLPRPQGGSPCSWSGT
jgi:hypothetical protein